LTETRRSIDGKSAVYLWKQCIRFSSFWRPENGIFAEFWNPRFRGHLIFCSVERRKCDFCRIMKTSAQKYQNSCEQIFPILAAWKRGSQDSGKIGFMDLILKKISTLKEKYQQTLVSWIGRNRFFTLPICVRYALTKVYALETEIFRLAKIAFSGLKNEENFSSFRGTLKQWFHESAEIVFGGCQNFWQVFLKQSLVHAKNLLIRSLVPLKRGFHYSEKLHFQASKLKKISSLCDVPSNVGFTNWKKMAFSGCQNAENLTTRKFAHTKLGILETWISRLGKIAFSGLKNHNYHTLCEVQWNVGFTNR